VRRTGVWYTDGATGVPQVLMNFDIPTALVLTAICTLLMSVSLLFAARSSSPSHRSLQRWAVASLCQGLGWALVSLRGVVPDWWSIIAGNGVVLISLTLFYRAVAEFMEQPPTRLTYVISGASVLLLVPLTYSSPLLMARIVIISLATAALMLLTGLTVLRGSVQWRPMSYWFTAIGFLLGAALSAARAISAPLLEPAMINPLASGLVQNLTFMSGYAGLILLTFSFLLMHHDRAQAALLRLATRDSLTGAYNRAMFEEFAHEEVARSRRDRAPMSLMVIDLDHFKSINDTYGHAAGDTILQTVVELIRRTIRAQDVVGRYGGEEFLALLPNATRSEALTIAERLRAAIAGADLQTVAPSLRITASIGIAELADDGYELLFQCADDALYKAKLAGRNRVVTHESILPVAALTV
jgi:diguanylate cyclase (GGDEF)-like protein